MPVWYRNDETGHEIHRGTVWEMAQKLDAAQQEVERLREALAEATDLRDSEERWANKYHREYMAANMEVKRLREELTVAQRSAYAGWVAATGFPIAEWVYKYHAWLRDYAAKSGGEE